MKIIIVLFNDQAIAINNQYNICIVYNMFLLSNKFTSVKDNARNIDIIRKNLALFFIELIFLIFIV